MIAAVPAIAAAASFDLLLRIRSSSRYNRSGADRSKQ